MRHWVVVIMISRTAEDKESKEKIETLGKLYSDRKLVVKASHEKETRRE
jgi:hypothetical protein